MNELPLACVEKVMRNAGAKRVSKSATQALTKILEEIGAELSQDAADFAKHANRKTVVDADIHLAHKNKR
ncbi:MAG: histone family protein [Candidatus Aenigmatarchaeota archaeon]